MKSLNDNHMRTQRYILEKEQVRFKLQHEPNKKLYCVHLRIVYFE